MTPHVATPPVVLPQKSEASPPTVKGKAEPTCGNLRRNATDEEILGLEAKTGKGSRAVPEVEPGPDAREHDDEAGAGEGNAGKLNELLEANPELRSVWQEAQEYRKVFATPQEAQAATALLADLDKMDALFFSGRPEDHRELAKSIAELDPTAFASLARAINAHLANGATREGQDGSSAKNTSAEDQARNTEQNRERPEAPGLSERQAEFFHGANASAVEGVLEAIEGQVERLLPEGVSRSARSRVVGEIYRELDTSLRSNRQLAQQLREAFRSGSQDTDHQRAVVALIVGRARQALPGVAKRVLQEWTSTLVTANQERRARQRTAERRVDIAGSGSGNDGRRGMKPRDIDYARMSDADILNL